MIELTVAAARRMHEALDACGEPLGVRVAARALASGGVEFALGLDEPRQGDRVLEERGVTLLVGVPSQDLLQGLRIDFGEIGPGALGFVFLAVPAPERAGCGGNCSCTGGKDGTEREAPWK